VSLQSTCWLRKILVSATPAELSECVGLAAQQIGFQYFLCYGRFRNRDAKVCEIHFSNCPDPWRRIAVGGDTESDPLHRRALREVTPIFWRDLVPHEPSWIARARDCGLATGVTLPVHGPDGQWSSLSLIKNHRGNGVERYIQAALGKSQLLAIFVHDVAGKIMRNEDGSGTLATERKAEACRLTGRERDCLNWIAAGKTTAQVARVLSVAERTVVFHLANARRKLGAANSHHAIMKAVSLGHIRAA